MLYSLELFLLILIVFDLLKNKKIYTPGVIFNGIFFITMFLYGFYMSYNQLILDYRTLWLLLLCVAMFNIPIFRSYYVPKTNFIQRKSVSVEVSSKREMVVYYIALAMFVIEILYSKGCPLVWKIIDDPKTYVDFGIPSFNGLFYAIVILMGSYSIFKKGCIYKYFYLLMGVLIISRQLIISIFIQGAILYCITHKLDKKFITIMAIGVVVGILLFSFMGNMRTGEELFLYVAQFKPKYDWVPTSFKWIYAYLCFSISNLNSLVRMTYGAVNYGATIFNELMPSVFNLRLPINQGFAYIVNPNFNVSTFIPDIYMDFGFLGVAIFCLALGKITSYVFRRVRVKDKAFQMFYIVIAHNILFLTFRNMFFYLPIMFELVLIPLIFMVDYGKLKNKTKNIINKILKRKGEN